MNLTIVTVCYNAEGFLERTFESAFFQSYTDYEYLVIDGGSNDNTINIVKQFQKKFLEKKIMFDYVSEPDQGIYDAMNKAIKQAKGKWIYFLNANDVFYDNAVLSKVFAQEIPKGIDVIYGKVVKKYKDHDELRKHNEIDEIVNGLPFCHQGAFVRTRLMKQQLFDLRYSICADYNFFLKLYLQGSQFQKIETIIAYYAMGGFSDRQYYKMLKEGYLVQKNNKILNWKQRLYLQCIKLPANWYHIKKVAFLEKMRKVKAKNNV